MMEPFLYSVKSADSIPVVFGFWRSFPGRNLTEFQISYMLRPAKEEAQMRRVAGGFVMATVLTCLDVAVLRHYGLLPWSAWLGSPLRVVALIALVRLLLLNAVVLWTGISINLRCVPRQGQSRPSASLAEVADV